MLIGSQLTWKTSNDFDHSKLVNLPLSFVNFAGD